MTRPADTQQRIPQWTLPDRLSKSRTAAGFNQRQMAEALGLKNRNTISRYESGQSTPFQAILIAWAAITGVSLAWLSGEVPTDQFVTHRSNTDRLAKVA